MLVGPAPQIAPIFNGNASCMIELGLSKDLGLSKGSSWGFIVLGPSAADSGRSTGNDTHS